MSVLARTREWFALRELESRIAKVPADQREKTSRAMRLSEQRRRGAEALWIAGFPADALELLKNALALAKEAVSGEAPEATTGGALDEEVTPADAATFRALLAEHDKLFAEREDLALGPTDVKKRRISRIATVALASVAFIGLLYFVLRTPRVLKATASAQYEARYEPGNAVDGSETTDWLLPDRTAGWIEVQVIPPRRVSKVKIVNARNIPFNDRATNEFKVDAFSGGAVVKTVEGRFEAYSPEVTARVIEIGAANVDRIRIEVKSWHQVGGGLSEIEVD
jgi:hypothetical protein